MDLTRRYLVGELMDAPDLGARDHHRALQGLRRVNQWSRTASVIAGAIAQHCRNNKLASLRVLDLACGGGDVTAQVARLLNRSGVAAQVHGWDRSPTAIDFASRQDAVEGAHPPVQFDVFDVFSEAPQHSFDVVYCTLFLHHLSDAQAEQLLKLMSRAASGLVLIDDLRRSAAGYALAVVGCQLLSRSPIVHVDGPLSVRAAFTESEIQNLSDRCGLTRPSIRRHWPHRFLLAWGARR